MMCDLRRLYRVGERHLIEWQIKPNKPTDIVVITKAKYNLLRGDEIIDSGNATVSTVDGKHIVSVLFKANDPGTFTLRIFVTVPPETTAAEIWIDVTG